MTVRSTALPKNIYSDTDIILSAGAGNTVVFDPAPWSDLQFSLSGARVPASNAPTWSAFTANTNKYTFGINDLIDLQTQELNHPYKQGTNLEIHLHAFNNVLEASDKYFGATIYYTVTNIGDTVVEGSVNADCLVPLNTTDKTHLYYDIGTVIGTTIKIGAEVSLRFKRVATGTGSEVANDPFIGMVGVHFQKDTLGSRSENAK